MAEGSERLQNSLVALWGGGGGGGGGMVGVRSEGGWGDGGCWRVGVGSEGVGGCVMGGMSRWKAQISTLTYASITDYKSSPKMDSKHVHTQI